jgi:hypothetical protein
MTQLPVLQSAPSGLASVDGADVLVKVLGESLLYSLERRFLDVSPNDLAWCADEGPRLEAATQLRLLRLEQLGALEPERAFEHLQCALEACRFEHSRLITAVHCDGARTSINLGVRSLANGNVAESIEHLRTVLESSLPGLGFEDSADCEPGHGAEAVVLDSIRRATCAAVITGVPSEDVGDGVPLQALDRLVDGLLGHRYTLLVIADPVPESTVNAMLDRTLQLGTEIHSMVRTNLNMAQALGETLSQTTTESSNTTEGTSDGVSTSSSDGENTTPRAGMGGALSAVLGLASAGAMVAAPGLGAVAGVLLGQVGMSLTSSYVQMGGSRSESKGTTETTGTNRSETQGTSLADSTSRSDTQTRSIALERLDKGAEYCERMLDDHARRLREGRGLGFWNTGVYLLSDDPGTIRLARALLRSNLAGVAVHEPLRTITLRKRALHEARRSLEHLNLPRLSLGPAGTQVAYPLGESYEHLATLLSTRELARVVNLPQRETPGLQRLPVVPFGLNPARLEAQDGLRLGRLQSTRGVLETPVGIPVEQLDRHAFVTGITGSGKTNTVFVLLAALAERGVPFLVIEPAKSEYRALAGLGIDDLRVYTLGDERASRFRLNPLQFTPGTNLVAHIDNIRATFNAAFPMYASMPYLLEQALVLVFEERGWDLAMGTNRHLDEQGHRSPSTYGPYMPRLSDLLGALDRVVKGVGFAEEATSNYLAALKARIGSLLTGSKGAMLDTRLGLSPAELFGSTTVLELRNVADEEEKAFLMAVLMGQLYAWREHSYLQGDEVGTSLQHVLVFEEAHRLLRNVSEAGNESAGSRARAVEAFANMLAELRQYGQGIVVVDQVASKLVPDVVKNTNLKVMHRVVAPDDRDFVGGCMGLNDDQKEHVGRLTIGEAVVTTSTEPQPLLVRVDLLKRAQVRLRKDGELAAAQRSDQHILRRATCAGCDSPCQHLSSATRADVSQRDGFARVVHAMVASDPQAAWQALDSWCGEQVERVPTLGQPGALRCLVAACAEVLASERRSSSGDLPAEIRYGREIMAAFDAYQRCEREAWETHLDHLRSIDASNSESPACSRPGCAHCAWRCEVGWVGAAVLREEPALTGPATRARLAAATDLGALRAAMRVALAGRYPLLPAAKLDGATYCWLAHLPIRERTLRAYLDLIGGPHND